MDVEEEPMCIEIEKTDELQNSDVEDLKIFDDTDNLQNSDVENMETIEMKANGTNNNNNCCRDKCLMMFDDQFKTQLKFDLWKLSNLERRIFLFAMISINEKKKNSGLKSKCFQYCVKEYGVVRSVCKTAFINLHGVTKSMVRNLTEKMIANHLVPTDRRGKHEKHVTIPLPVKELIKTHLFETLESPTIFNCAKKRSGMPNMQQLWENFKEKHEYYLPCTTYSKYARTFLTTEVLTKFMCANEARKILEQLKKSGY